MYFSSLLGMHVTSRTSSKVPRARTKDGRHNFADCEKTQGEFWPLKLEVAQRVRCSPKFSGKMAVIPDFSQIATFSKFFSAKPTDCRFSKCFPFFLCQGKHLLVWQTQECAFYAGNEFPHEFLWQFFCFVFCPFHHRLHLQKWGNEMKGKAAGNVLVSLNGSPSFFSPGSFQDGFKICIPNNWQMHHLCKIAKRANSSRNFNLCCLKFIAKCLMFLQAFGSGE